MSLCIYGLQHHLETRSTWRLHPSWVPCDPSIRVHLWSERTWAQGILHHKTWVSSCCLAASSDRDCRVAAKYEEMLSGMKSCFAFHWRWLNSSAWYLFRDCTSGKRTCPLQLCAYPINSHFLLRGVPESISWGNADHDRAASNAVVKFGLRWYPAGSHSMASSTTKPAHTLRYKITRSVS